MLCGATISMLLYFYRWKLHNFFFQYERGYERLTGMDYSEQAIELAKSIAKDKQHKITYKVSIFLVNFTLVSIFTLFPNWAFLI